jgi:hypothetical protein
MWGQRISFINGRGFTAAAGWFVSDLTYVLVSPDYARINSILQNDLQKIEIVML